MKNRFKIFLVSAPAALIMIGVGCSHVSATAQTSTAISTPATTAIASSSIVPRAYMGVNALTDVNSSVAAQYNLAVNSGVMIGEIVLGGPADKAGLKAKDVIVAVDGTAVIAHMPMVAMIQLKAPGTKIEITFYRGADKSTVTVTLGAAS